MFGIPQRLQGAQRTCSSSATDPLLYLPVTRAKRQARSSCQHFNIPGCSIVCQATGDSELPSTSASHPSHSVRRAYEALANPRPRPGAEYGEGFVQFRLGGDPIRLDVDTLNEKLKHAGAARLRHQLSPDQAFGVIFSFDRVVCNTRDALERAYQQLADVKGLPLPKHASLSLHNTCPERIIMDVLRWTQDLNEARALAWELSSLYAAQLEQLSEPHPGIRQWLDALSNFKVPIALVSELDKQTVRRALERMHLHDHFSILVAAEDDHENAAQRFLSAALQMQRPPNLCVVFDAAPEAVTAAHNCTMKAVAIAGTYYPRYQLQQADVTCTSFKELTVFNIRRLFSMEGDEFMNLRKQASGDKDSSGGRRRRITNAVFD